MAGLEWPAWVWFSIATVLTPLRMVPNVYDHRKEILKWCRNRSLPRFKIPVSVLGVMAVAGVVGVVWIYEAMQPRSLWVHPTLSKAEQAQRWAECQMQAIQAVPSKGFGFVTHAERANHWDVCLPASGFPRIAISENEPQAP